MCEAGETPTNCSNDCKVGCGDCKCEGGEDFISCPIDCGYCGDQFCSQCLKETTTTCAKDCL